MEKLSNKRYDKTEEIDSDLLEYIQIFNKQKCIYSTLSYLSQLNIITRKRYKMSKRMIQSLIGGALLGVVCVIGAMVRSGFTATPVFVFSLWYNRVVIGLAIGAPWPKANRNLALLRGALLGLLVSFAFYSATGFVDPVSFVAGVVYGVILEAWFSRS